MPQELTVIQKTYDLIVWAVPAIAKFPRSLRFVLGERMENVLYDILEQLIEAKYSKKGRRSMLRTVNVQIEKLRFQIRIAKDLRCLGVRQYEYVSGLVLEVGKLVGGWKKVSA